MNAGLLREIESDLLSDRPLADVLRKVVLLGERTGSPELRDWASRELKGFEGVNDVDLPNYRRFAAAMYVDGFAGHNQSTGHPLPYAALPDFVREAMPDEFLARAGVAELAALSARSDSIHFSLPGPDIIARFIDSNSGNPSQRTVAVYWAIPSSAFIGVLDQVKTALVELISELVAATPSSQSSPTSDQVARAVSMAIHGLSARVTVHAQTSGHDSTVTTAGSGDTSGWWTRARKIGAVIVACLRWSQPSPRCWC